MRTNTWKNLKIHIALVCAIGLTVALASCDEVDEAFDCAEICEEFKRCFDSELDVNDCVDTCFDAVEADTELRADADDCAGCIDNQACNEVNDACPSCQPVFDAFKPQS